MTKQYFEEDPLWYKDAIIYELHVRSFYDSNEDGIGDFKGLKKKLSYLEELGITAIWLLPFYPSPLKDDGYDIANYYNINKDYGSLRDFREFLKAAHQHGIRVIIELVLNHTSNDHVWFQQSRNSKSGSSKRNFYIWSNTPEKYKDARIIFKDFENSNWAWDPVAGAYYWHRFYSHQPDLNYDNPSVKKAMFQVIDFWFKLGVDGLRLDAVPYLFKREGTNCENLPETHNFLKKLRSHVDKKYRDKMLLAEANQWPEDASAYFGKSDECHMAFHFPLMPRIFMAIQMEDSFPVIDILKTTPSIPDGCQWAIFLRNHDELTLEMVTDEERDYMYRVYGKDPRSKINLGIRRRLAPLLKNDRRRIELMNILLFSLPGTPFIYYGDEIGIGDNYYLGDRKGVRVPMQWSPDRNAGFSQTNPQRLFLPVIIDPEYSYEVINVENQEKNSSSLLWWIRKVISMRKRFKSFSRGTLEIIHSDNFKILSFVRCYQNEIILVVINLSRFCQLAELDLSKFIGFIPEEVFSHNRFPKINENKYILTLAPHTHFWFLLKQETEKINVQEQNPQSLIRVTGKWDNILKGKHKKKFEEKILPLYLKNCRWFGAKGKIIRHINIIEDASVKGALPSYHLLIVKVKYTEGAAELYLIPISFVLKRDNSKILIEYPESFICYVMLDNEEGIIYDSIYDKHFHSTTLLTIANRRKIKGINGEFMGFPGKKLKSLIDEKKFSLASYPTKSEQSNSSIVYENKLFLKLYRRLDEGINPETEIIKFLTEHPNHLQNPTFAGSIEYRTQNTETITVAILQGFVENKGDAWNFTIDSVIRFLEQALSKRDALKEFTFEHCSLLELKIFDIPPLLQELIGGLYLEMAYLLGERTAELHLALASFQDDENFRPEPFSLHYQRSVYQSMQSLVTRTMRILANNKSSLPESISIDVEEILSNESEILKRMQKILSKKLSTMKIRIHGDYHLGQVLYTGKDFVIMDFEGEPARPLGERRLKRSPFRDIAGMIRSFHYAAYSAILLNSSFRPEDMALLELWIDHWYFYISGIFLHSYLDRINEAPFLPKDSEEIEILLHTFLLEKAIYELSYELNNRPNWLGIPIKGIKSILELT